MRVYGFRSDISRRSVKGLLDELRREPVPAKVIIDSRGGTFTFFSTLGPAIERQGIITVGLDVRSAANILFLLGHHRQAFSYSTFFFHEIRAIFENGEITLTTLEEAEEYMREMRGELGEQYQEFAHQLKSAQNWYIDYIAAKSGVSRPTLLNLMRSEATLSAREALHYGLVHQIVREEELLG